MDKFGVGRIIDQTVEFKGKSYKADVFTSPDTKNALYLFEVPERNYENPENEYMEAKKAPIKVPYRVYVGTEKKGVTSFDTMGKAMQAVELVFTREDLKERILMKQLDLQKKMILNKVEELINSPSGALPVEDMSDGFKVFSNFQSGDDKVTLEGDEKQYKVCTNGIPSVVTEDFREALAKYYSSVSRIVDTQNEDKDIGLELFGEHVLNTSRNTRRMMAELDRGMEAKMLSELDYSEISLPFNPEFILKYDPQNEFFGIVPATQNSEEVECPSETGGAIGRKDLKEKEYHKGKKDEVDNQKAIEEEDADGIQPAIISNSLNQPQMIPTRQEENLTHYPVEKPIKVKNTYQQNLRNLENRPIEQRYGTQ
jgi:hypothetical protein